MKIFVIGGTGLVGSYLLPRLVRDNHETCVLTRNKDRIEKISNLGAIGIPGDITDPDRFIHTLPWKPEIIVLLAMPAVMPGKRMTRKRKAELRKDTNAFFRNSIDLARQFDIPVILPGGTSYRTVGDEVADEGWSTLRAGLTEIGTDTDAMVEEALKTSKPRAVQLMYGRIYGNGGLFRFMFNMIDKERMRIIGKGDNCIPNIHADDAALAIEKAIEKLPVGEKFIVADDRPVTQKEFMEYMARLMDRKPPKQVPGFIISLVLGPDFYKVASMNCRVSNAKAKRILDWQPRYPDVRSGLPEVIKEMRQKANYFD
jgi:nucleoside-diphosphate-sugar epimerase